MTEIIALVFSSIGKLVEIGLEAKANAEATEAAVLAKLKVVLATSAALVDAQLAKLDDARAAADRKIADGAPTTEVLHAALPPPQGDGIG